MHIDPDDTVWAWWSDSDGVTTVSRLDDIDRFYFADVATLPATFVGGDGDDGEGQQRQWPAIAIHDGTIWALAGDPVGLLRYVGGEWQEQPPLPEPDWEIRTENGHGLVVGPDGNIWVALERCHPLEEPSDWIVCAPGLARFDSVGWTVWDWEQVRHRSQAYSRSTPDCRPPSAPTARPGSPPTAARSGSMAASGVASGRGSTSTRSR